MKAPVTGGHRAEDDGTGHCRVCRVTVVDQGRGIQHQRGWAARNEAMALGLPYRTRVAKSGSWAARVAVLEDANAILQRELDDARTRLAAILPIEERLDRIEALLSRRPQVDHRRVADGGSRVKDQLRRAA